MLHSLSGAPDGRRRRRSVAGGALLLLLFPIVTAYASETPATIAEATEGYEHHSGFLDLYFSADEHKLYVTFGIDQVPSPAIAPVPVSVVPRLLPTTARTVPLVTVVVLSYSRMVPDILTPSLHSSCQSSSLRGMELHQSSSSLRAMEAVGESRCGPDLPAQHQGLRRDDCSPFGSFL